MVAIKAHEADRTLARLDPAWRLILFYGPDAGLVSSEPAISPAKASTIPTTRSSSSAWMATPSLPIR